MSYFSQNKTTLWVLIAVVFFNIAAIFTIYYKMHCASCHRKEMEKKPGCFQDYLSTELNLTPAQKNQFDNEKTKYHDTVLSVHKLMIEKRTIISDELSKPEADTAILYKASDELGLMYAKTRKLYVNHYLALSKICNAEQKKKLAHIMGDMFCCEGRNNEMMPMRKHEGMPPNCGHDHKNRY
jgi:hypothetical protein